MVKATFIRNFVNPIAISGIMRSKRFAYFKEIQERQWLGFEENKEMQKERVYGLLKYCEKEIPYYFKIIRKKKLKFSKETIFKDIAKLPPLTKEDIRENSPNLVNFECKRKWSKDTSGGSTGEPIVVYHDKIFNDYGAAAKILFNEWAGRREGELMVKLLGSKKWWAVTLKSITEKIKYNYAV
jgi:phenylacetate-CoA ligase